MKTQYTDLRDLVDAVETARRSKKDMIADTRNVAFVPANGEGSGLVLAVKDQGRFPVNEHAHHQIANRLSIPRAYYDRMLQEAPDLLMSNANTWFERQPERRMVRTLDGRVRAFLSDRYQRVENESVLAAIYPILSDFGSDLQIQSMALTEKRMYLKATVKSVRAEIKVGDIVEAGIEVRNGEIGNSQFEVWPFANRLTCLNGMRFDVGGFKRRHVGARADVTDEVYEMLQDDTLAADDKAFLLKARDVVKATLSDETFGKFVAKMREATEERIEGNPVKAVEVLAETIGLTETEQGSVLRHLIEAGDLSRWGVANAVTRTAQDVESYDRSDELEGLGGNVIAFTKKEWTELAKAA